MLALPDGSIALRAGSYIFVAMLEAKSLMITSRSQIPYYNISDPILLPAKENILFLSFNFSNHLPLAVMFLNYRFEKQHTASLNFSFNDFVGDTLLALPNNRVAFFNRDINVYSNKYLFIYDIDHSHLTKIHLQPASTMEFDCYDRLLLIDNRYLIVGGSSYAHENIAIQIFDITKKKIIKVKEKMLEQCSKLEVLPDGRLITCNKAGNIVLHNILPQSEKLVIETASALWNLPPDIIDTITDYAGIFRYKSQKSQAQDVFEERRIEDLENKKGCIIS